MRFLRGLLLLTTMALWACGGGGGGSSSSSSGDAFSISTGAVAFSATQGGATPAAQTVNVTALGATVFFATSQSGTGFSHSFQLTGPTTGRITITPDPPNGAGTFTGTITVRGCSTQFCTGSDVAGSPKTINVTYTVGGALTLSSTPAFIDFESNTGAIPPSKNVTLSLSSGAVGWQVVTINYFGGPQGWLTLTPSAGVLNPSQTVAFSVNSAPLIAEVRHAAVIIQAGSLAQSIPVTYTITDPVVNFVSPHVVPVGAGGNVIIRGHGFFALNAAATTVEFIPLGPTAAKVVSDTEIQVPAPSTGGTFAIAVRDGTRTIPSRAGLRLLVVNPPGFPAATIARSNTPGLVGNLIYDAERQALYLMDPDNNRIERYRFVAGNWTADSLVTGVGGGNPRIALSPDGAELLKTSGASTVLWRIDPATLGVLSSPDAASLLASGANLNLIAFANDGRAIGNSYSPANGISLYRYNMLTQQFTALSTQADMTNRTIVASADGETLVLPSFEPLTPAFAKRVFTYDASSGALTQQAVTSAGTEHASVSRDGSRIILVSFPLSASQATTVYNAAFTALGTLPADLTGFAISPDGSTAYAYFPTSGLVRKFNLNAPSGGGFVELGTGTAVSSPGSFFSEMTITPDGGTLFLAGNQRLIVLPAP
jgi:hypothetical protein